MENRINYLPNNDCSICKKDFDLLYGGICLECLDRKVEEDAKSTFRIVGISGTRTDINKFREDVVNYLVFKPNFW